MNKMWGFGLLLIVPALFDKVSSESPMVEGCFLSDDRFYAVGERWSEPMGDGTFCGLNCVCYDTDAFGCNGCPLTAPMPKPQAPPLTRKSMRTMPRERRETETTCEYNGKTYQPGDNFDSDDGCNGCTCTSKGHVACTLRMCLQGCSWKGMFLDVGQTYLDGCSVCKCLPKNKIDCRVDRCHPEARNDGSNRNADFGQQQQQRQSILDIYDPDIPAL